MSDTDDKKPRQRTERPAIRILLTHDEAAVALAISPRKLDQWVAEGRLRKRGEGQLVRYLLADVEALAHSLPVMEPGT